MLVDFATRCSWTQASVKDQVSDGCKSIDDISALLHSSGAGPYENHHFKNNLLKLHTSTS